MLIAIAARRVDAERAGLRAPELAGSSPPPRTRCSPRPTGMAPPVAELLVGRTEGNPLALLEVPQPLSAAQLAGQPADRRSASGRPRRWCARCCTGSPGCPTTYARALLVAAASGGERVQPVRRRARGARPRRDVLDGAEQAGALALAGERFEFRHPLLRSAIYHGAPGAGAPRGACARSRA